MNQYAVLIAIVGMLVWCQGGPSRYIVANVPIRPKPGRPAISYHAPVMNVKAVCGGRWPSGFG